MGRYNSKKKKGTKKDGHACAWYVGKPSMP